jgi:preprotein translocase subunit SecE
VSDESQEPPATPAESTRGAETAATPARKPKRERSSPRQFLREVRSELRKVAWPGRKELLSYSLVVLVVVALITLYITGLDQVFGTLIFRIFS